MSKSAKRLPVIGLAACLMALAASTSPGTSAAAPAQSQTRNPAMNACPPLLDHRFPDLLSGQPQSLCSHAGKVVLVVNTASRCGYTPQYKGLEALYRQYRDRGLVVLGFPSNDFGAQEPGSSKDIADFCEMNYGVSFPMFEKSPVSGAAANPLHAALARAAGSAPQWNFHKYLIDRRGTSVRSYPSAVDPADSRLRKDIENLLAQ
jgi:glutathione peroxidase